MPRDFVAFDQTRFTIEPVVPELTAPDQVIGTSHGVSFGPGLSHFCRTVTKSFLAPEGIEVDKSLCRQEQPSGNAGFEPTTSGSGGH
ncbi:MAG TPA: hypothetical protein ENH82_14105 [bacterium]|nr:hypothetical protein [bacterium]